MPEIPNIFAAPTVASLRDSLKVGARVYSTISSGRTCRTNAFLRSPVLWNLQDTEDIILNTAFGLSFPLLGNLEAAAEILLEYDTGAVEDVEELDQTYKFRIGYTW